MKKIGDRISFEDSKFKTTVVIIPERNHFVNMLMGAWLGMWYCIGAVVIWSLFHLVLLEQERIILYIFLLFWCYYAFRISKSYLWLLFGKELLKLNKDAFFIKRSFFRYGKLTPYYYDNIADFHFEIPEGRTIQAIWESSPWVSGGERFEFEYFGKVKKFGRKLNQRDSKLLSNLLISKIKSFSK
ncbi:MAG: hypothetical protein QNK70_02515 [Crocinitomicaceae bacterium]|tara:strand:+ start:3131 stop:3685 length:555 start_codon:yes stop_codon:yes gene_type:complete